MPPRATRRLRCGARQRRAGASWSWTRSCRRGVRAAEGAGDEGDIQGRISQIKAEIENTGSDYDREKLQERLAKLAGVTHTRSTLADGNPKLLLRTKEVEANRAGFDKRELAERLDAQLALGSPFPTWRAAQRFAPWLAWLRQCFWHIKF